MSDLPFLSLRVLAEGAVAPAAAASEEVLEEALDGIPTLYWIILEVGNYEFSFSQISGVLDK